MAKKHHFVPQFLLKKFSEDGKQIHTFVVQSKTEKTAPIESMCQKENLYGSDQILEEAFSKIETKIAPVLDVFSLSNIDHRFLLCLLMATLDSRQEIDAKRMAAFEVDVLKNCIQVDQEFTKLGIDVEDLNIELDKRSIYASLLQAAYKLASTICNASHQGGAPRFCILEDKKNRFVISDNPVVHTNTFRNQRLHKDAHYNLVEPGNMIMCPLSSSKNLLVYDSNIYRIKAGQLSDQDVMTCNHNQFRQARNNIFFRNRPDVLLDRDVQKLIATELEIVKKRTGAIGQHVHYMKDLYPVKSDFDFVSYRESEVKFWLRLEK